MIDVFKWKIEKMSYVNSVISKKDGDYDFKSFGESGCLILWFVVFWVIKRKVIEFKLREMNIKVFFLFVCYV